jgi:fatty-acyl-CoA synthase
MKDLGKKLLQLYLQLIIKVIKEEKLIEETRSIIAAYKLPKTVIFTDEVQRAPNGKANYKWAKSFAEEQLS